jgi:hypothetical protein
MITKAQAWQIYRNTTTKEIVKWERTDDEYIAKWGHAGGLLLAGCPKCGKFETRETYVSGFWEEKIELVTDYTCIGVEKCKCGQWLTWSD